MTTYTEFDCLDGYNSEVNLGKKIAEACAKAEVEHVIYNNTLSVVQVLGLSARHLDAKSAIGEAMKARGLPLTCVITPCFYQQLLVPPLRPKQLDKNSFGFGEYKVNTILFH